MRIDYKTVHSNCSNPHDDGFVCTKNKRKKKEAVERCVEIIIGTDINR